MESQGQGHPSWNTRGRRATIFPQRDGARTLGLSALPAQDEAEFLTPRERRYRPPLVKKRAMCDFRVRWPEIVSKEQETEREDLPRPGLHPLDRVGDLSPCSSVGSISLKPQDSSHGDFQGSQVSLTHLPETLAMSPYMKILNNYLKPQLMTRLEKRVRRKTLVAMNQMEQEMEAVKLRREVLLRDARELQDERACEEAENKPLVDYLRMKNQRAQEKYNFLWKDYIQQCQEIENRRRELVSAFASRTDDLRKRLSQGKKMEVGLRKKRRALDPIAQIKESQGREKEALEQEEASIVADIPFMDREAHLQFLKEKAALQKQVEELNLLESGEGITRELKKKAKALAAMVKQAHKDFCQGINAENRRLRTQLQQLDREFRELQIRKEELEQGKQRWKEQQWYLEALARGRQRLQRREFGPPKPQAAPHPTRGRLLEARLKTNPK
ncbi:coiled-coil domain-containing protein 121 [Phodopus roborovskii]|uniref:Gm6588 protein n=1 Tax=Phodopus roborovskii TaxID=109678 RepID=A0AAU9YTU9_PHORO|nr:coiled-coil domain-containing protein 121 [Phodopus roborovskii]CAH6778728.1 Gm6588 [Phodopus roborovskii]